MKTWEAVFISSCLDDDTDSGELVYSHSTECFWIGSKGKVNVILEHFTAFINSSIQPATFDGVVSDGKPINFHDVDK